MGNIGKPIPQQGDPAAADPFFPGCRVFDGHVLDRDTAMDAIRELFCPHAISCLPRGRRQVHGAVFQPFRQVPHIFQELQITPARLELNGTALLNGTKLGASSQKDNTSNHKTWTGDVNITQNCII